MLKAEARRHYGKIAVETAGSLTGGNGVCWIVHESSGSPDALQQLLDAYPQSCVVVATGAAIELSGALTQFRAHHRVAGMPLVYGREANFASWFEAWSRDGLDAEGFEDVAHELIAPSANTGPAAARRLLPALSRLHTTLSGYVFALDQVSDDEAKARLQEWLRHGLDLWLAEASEEIRAEDVGTVTREFRQTEAAEEARDSIRYVKNTAERVKGLRVDVPTSVRQFADYVAKQRVFVRMFAEGNAGHLRIAPLDQLFELRQAVLALGASAGSGLPLPHETAKLLFSDGVCEALTAVIDSAVPPYDTRKRLVRMLDSVHSADAAQRFREGTSAEGAARAAYDNMTAGVDVVRAADAVGECRIIVDDLQLLHWLAYQDAYEAMLGYRTHQWKGIFGSMMGHLISGERNRDDELIAILLEGVSGITDTLHELVTDFGPRFGLIPSAVFGREYATLRDLVPTILDRIRHVNELSPTESRATHADIWQIIQFGINLSSRRRFAIMFDDFAAELLEEGHDARS
jgi:hypothetical protein